MSFPLYRNKGPIGPVSIWLLSAVLGSPVARVLAILPGLLESAGQLLGTHEMLAEGSPKPLTPGHTLFIHLRHV